MSALNAPPRRRIDLELVDEDGVTIGTAEKMRAHQPPGHLHRAFSVFLFDADDRMLLQRRAPGKYHSPAVWSNACCGHPFVGEPPAVAAARRVREELGNPDEVADVAFAGPRELAERLARDPFSAWFRTVLQAAHPTIEDVTGVSWSPPLESRE